MNNEFDSVANGEVDVSTSKAGDAVAALTKILIVVFVMVIATLICFAICGAFEMSMGKTVFVCVVGGIFGGLFVAETFSGGKY